MKSVRTRIMLMTLLLLVTSLLVVSGITVYLNRQTTRGILEQTMVEMAENSSKQFSNHLKSYKIIVESAANDRRVVNPDATLEEKQAALDDAVKHYPDFTRGNILAADGSSIFTGDSFEEREYYQKAIAGTTWVSEPLVSKVTGRISIIIAAPIWENGIYGGKVTGVLYLVPVETFLNDAVADIKISDNASAQIINKNGTVIAHPDMEVVTNESNAQEEAKTDSAMAQVAALEQEMMAGNTGFGTYSTNGEEKFLGYAPIADSDGWSIGVNTPIKDFMSYTNRSILFTMILLAVSVLFAIIVSLRLAASIGKPINILAGILSSMADTGRMDVTAEAERHIKDYSVKKDEIGMLSRSAGGLVEMLGTKADYLTAVAGGDLSSDIVCKSPEDTVGNALMEMLDNLNQMFSGINEATTQVTAVSRQIANGSQILAQGSTEQAAAVEQLSSSVSEIANKTKENAEMADRTANLANSIKEIAEQGSQQMDEMMTAVKEINEAGQSINKVIKVIDDIAFQTNILALNAAVEAARAGQHGKGFAVVAEEVRSLAAKSGEAAKETGGLIVNSIQKAELGARIADETAESLMKIVSGINESSQLVTEIARSTSEQNEGISQVNKGIDQVAQVVQQNSATAQESAAASREMSEQAQILEGLVEQFKLRDSGTRERQGGKLSGMQLGLPAAKRDANDL